MLDRRDGLRGGRIEELPILNVAVDLNAALQSMSAAADEDNARPNEADDAPPSTADDERVARLKAAAAAARKAAEAAEKELAEFEAQQRRPSKDRGWEL